MKIGINVLYSLAESSIGVCLYVLPIMSDTASKESIFPVAYRPKMQAAET